MFSCFDSIFKRRYGNKDEINFPFNPNLKRSSGKFILSLFLEWKGGVFCLEYLMCWTYH